MTTKRGRLNKVQCMDCGLAFQSGAHAERKLGLAPGVVSRAMRKGHKVGGHTWARVEPVYPRTIDGKRTPLYGVWIGMKARCFDPHRDGYHRYGGRGIAICQEWLDDFDVFAAFALENGWREGLTVDRFPNNDGNYEPSNVRFVTQKVNCQNREVTEAVRKNGPRLGLASRKPVRCIETGKVFPSAHAASMWGPGVSRKAVSDAIRRGHKCGGHTWKYV